MGAELKIMPKVEALPPKDFFNPKRFGFSDIVRDDQGVLLSCTKIISGTNIRFTRLGPEHISPEGNPPQSAYDLVALMQENIFKIKDRREIIPPHSLSHIDAAGGSVIVADTGTLTAETMLGFSIAYASNNGSLPSKSLGVAPDARDKGLALSLKGLQACIAAERGYKEIEWATDPLEGKNGNLFVGHLGALPEKYAIMYYGNSAHNEGKKATDRFLLRLDLRSKDVQGQFNNMFSEKTPPISLASIEDLPIVGTKQDDTLLLQGVLKTKPNQLLYEVPNEISKLEDTNTNEEKWRNDMREVLSGLIDTIRYYYPDNSGDKANVKIEETKGEYMVSKFIRINGRNFYLLTRKLSQ